MGLFTKYKGLEDEKNVQYKNIPFNEDNSFNSQPFIQTAPPGDNGGFSVASNVKGFIPKLTSGLTAGVLNLTDGLNKTIPSLGSIARGTYRSATDVVRLTKFMATPSGLEFIAKQELLSRMAVQTEISNISNGSVYNPLTTLSQAGVSFAGIHLQPYEPIIGYGEAAYSAGQINPNLYSNNRLVGLHDTHILNQSPSPDILFRYDGGPGSIFGIGATDIKFSTNPAGITPVRTMGANFIFPEGAPKNPQQYQAQYDSSLVPAYEDGKDTLAGYYNMGDPGQTSYSNGIRREKSLSIPLDRVNARFIYSSNQEPQEENPNYRDLIRFKIGILDVNKDTTNYIHFRAIIDSFGDSYNSDWSAQTYMGRGEKLYKYNSFDRSINISFTVAAQSQAEMFGMYQKLNYLASTVTPQYTDHGYMTGNIAKLTVGNYVKDQHGKIDSISFEIPEESPWLVGMNTDFLNTRMGEMPFIIKVQMRYTVIHDFRPELVTNVLGEDKNGNPIPKFGDQRYITYKVDKDNEDYQIRLNQKLDEVYVTAKSVSSDVLIPPLYYSKPKETPPPVSTSTPISQTPLQLKNGQLLENSGDNSPGFSKSQGGQYSYEDNSSNFSKSQGDPFPSSNSSSTQKSNNKKKKQNRSKGLFKTQPPVR